MPLSPPYFANILPGTSCSSWIQCAIASQAELHLHIEGTLEPELMFELAQRNDALDSLPCKTLQEMKAAYNFQDLQSFLNLYYAGCAVLRTDQVSASLLWHLQGNLNPLLLVWMCSSKVKCLSYPQVCPCVHYKSTHVLNTTAGLL